MLSGIVSSALAWSNGGYSADPSNPGYGTHDRIAEHAIAWLPAAGKAWINANRVPCLYGTELPDNAGALDERLSRRVVGAFSDC